MMNQLFFHVGLFHPLPYPGLSRRFRNSPFGGLKTRLYPIRPLLLQMGGIYHSSHDTNFPVSTLSVLNLFG
jgi:hypothetical protein